MTDWPLKQTWTHPLAPRYPESKDSVNFPEPPVCHDCLSAGAWQDSGCSHKHWTTQVRTSIEADRVIAPGSEDSDAGASSRDAQVRFRAGIYFT